VFPHVPVRANHPGMFDGGDINNVGGYITELKRIGKKLVADIRVTRPAMKENIEEGTFINRSSEIGTYDDNKGNIYFPVLFGFAWVDIPQVEGLSPTFSYSKNKNFSIINLNNDKIMGEEIKDEFPLKEEKVEEVVETPAEEIPAEEKKAEVPAEEEKAEEEIPEEISKEIKKEEEEKIEEPVEAAMSKQAFAKSFPAEFAELQELKKKELENIATEYVRDGKAFVASKEALVKFMQTLNKEQFSSFEEIMKTAPKVIKYNDEPEEKELEAPAGGSGAEPTPEVEAEKFIEETK
jgi:hypothetical protein